jgi:hypothetical protein
MAALSLLLVVLVLGIVLGTLVTYAVLDVVLVDREVDKSLREQVQRERGLRQRLQSALETLRSAAGQVEHARALQDELAQMEKVWRETEASLDELKGKLKDTDSLKLTNAELENLWKESEGSKAEALRQFEQLRGEQDRLRKERDSLRQENTSLQEETGRLRSGKSRRRQYEERVALLLRSLLPNLEFVGDSVANIAFDVRDPEGALVLLRRLSVTMEPLKSERVDVAGDWLEAKYNDGKGEGRLYYRKATRDGKYVVLVSVKQNQPQDIKNLRRW